MHRILDLGGHAARAISYEPGGGPRAAVEVPVATRCEGGGRVEQDPDELIAALRKACREIGDPTAQGRTGFAVHRSSVVCWDRISGAALSPVLSWQDRRAGPEWLPRSADRETVARRTGLPMSRHYGAPKLAWCIDRLPAVHRALEAGRLECGPLSAYVVRHLADDGVARCDPATAGRTLLWNRDTRAWDDELCALFGVPREVLPALVDTVGDPGPHPLGVVIGDQNAVVFADGPPDPATVWVNLGTGAFVLRPTGPRAVDVPGFASSIARVEGDDVHWLVEGAVNGAGSALTWLRDTLGIADVVDRLPGWLGSVADAPVFLNGVAGLGSPWWRADFPVRFEGDAGADDAARSVAVAESIAFLVAENVAGLGVVPPAPKRIRIGGGLARLDGLCARIATLTGLPVTRGNDLELTARGVARLLDGIRDAAVLPPGRDTFEPRRDSALEARHRRWRDVMDAATG